MPKYSTGSGGGSGDGDSCELCGQSTTTLTQANVAGAELLVCQECAPHDDAGAGPGSNNNEERSDDEPSREKRAVQQHARMHDQATGDSRHWEREGTNYEQDQLPYLVSEYGEIAASARQAAGFTIDELATELDVESGEILAVEQGRATRAGIGGSLIRKLESTLDVTLVDE
ncbi:MAG: putative eukaryotic MBF1-like transcription factor [Haloquadratum walsbyi J07HQW1]|jgi:transcriptional regulator, XRE family|uniref:Putative eukaryotic MBF1-like transcription factor n=1 Tax=Haloquadratum walsbyi J07HQW1 TaxID=1238424 RepID=U1N8H6_9EURY|nr:MAG: putative eukaryotic MBF1-like transcription factor [Haloquadratum walsbyi J07HQW1]